MPQSVPDPKVLLAHTQSLRAIAPSLLRNEADVDDVVQETWLAVLRSQPDDARPLGGWLATVARASTRPSTRLLTAPGNTSH